MMLDQRAEGHFRRCALRRRGQGLSWGSPSCGRAVGSRARPMKPPRHSLDAGASTVGNAARRSTTQ